MVKSGKKEGEKGVKRWEMGGKWAKNEWKMSSKHVILVTLQKYSTQKHVILVTLQKDSTQKHVILVTLQKDSTQKHVILVTLQKDSIEKLCWPKEIRVYKIKTDYNNDHYKFHRTDPTARKYPYTSPHGFEVGDAPLGECVILAVLIVVIVCIASYLTCS